MIQDRGFASMNPNKQREIASKGGRAAHQKGTAHEWTREQAREAGRKGGRAAHQRGYRGTPDGHLEPHDAGLTDDLSHTTIRSDDPRVDLA